MNSTGKTECECKEECACKKEEKMVKVYPVTPRNKIGRNQTCPCGSQKKYKKCCMLKRTYTPSG